MTADTCKEKDDQIAVLAKMLRMVGHTSLCERAQYLGRSCICDLETVLADLPAAARERAEESERLRSALKGRCCTVEIDGEGNATHEQNCPLSPDAGKEPNR